ncbi:MAG: M28 family peptidase, partial [candidate division WOR-3 bacterium]
KMPGVRMNPIIQDIVNNVNPDSILSSVQRLQDYVTRYSTHDSCDAAADWVANKFTAYGCDSVFLQYHTGNHAPNVIAIKRGVLYPEDTYVVIDGHLDATSFQAPNIAPGADDDASGTVAAIEAARVMKDYSFEYSVRYIAFTGEEFGLYGSEYYVAQAYAQGHSILGVMNGDMIAYVDASPEDLNVVVNSANSAFGDFFIACADTYTTILTVKDIVGSVPSDIQPFYDYGYPGMCAIEDNWPVNPYYHTPGDTIGSGFNNLPFCTEATRAEIAALCVLARPYGSAEMPEIPTLMTPLDYGRLPDLQPTLTFYSTDPNSDDIQYRIVWDDDPNFGTPDSGTTPTYPSGSIVSYTIPTPLTDGVTYWWKVKATDPAGSGFWTLYATERSFTIGTSLPPATCSWYQNTNAQWVNDALNGTMVEGDSIVLGGVMAYDTLLEEHFESPGIPAGWNVIDGNSDGYMWTVGTTSDMSSYTPPNYGSRYAYYSDDDAGSGTINYNEELVSPSIYTGGIAALELIYGYGFRVYQNGEKYRVKIRTYNGGWSTWSDLQVYTTSNAGTETIDLGSYLPCDSVQIDWFYSDSTSSSHWGWACAVDNVLLRRGYLIIFDEGTVTGTDVVFDELSATYSRTGWGDAVWTKSAPAESIGIQVEYYNGAIWQLVPDGVLPGNSTGFFTIAATDTVSINMLDTLTYGTLRLVGSLYRNATDPALLNWEVGNLANYVGIAEEDNAGNKVKPFLSVHPNITKTGLSVTFAIGNPHNLVELSVYDAMGRKVKDLIEDRGMLNTFNEIYWNGTDDFGRKVAAGVYFVRYESDSVQKVEKAVLVR